MASRGINKVILVGKLGSDPEIRYLPNGGAVANITIATSELWRDKATGGEPRKNRLASSGIFRQVGRSGGGVPTQRGTSLHRGSIADSQMERPARARPLQHRGSS